MRAALTGIAASLTLLAAVPVLAGGALTAKSFAAAVADPARPAADTARDADRRPAELMAFAGVRPGLKIAELAPGGGYFTRLLSLAVGPAGHVYTASGKPAAAVVAWSATHPNTTMQVFTPTPGAALAPEPADMVWTTLNYHDFKNVPAGDTDAAARFNQAAFAALKPGGVYLIVDHEAAKGAGATLTNTLHRIESALVIRDVEAAGFRLAGRSKLLQHKADDHTLKVNETGIRGKTDQFALRFVKPR